MARLDRLGTLRAVSMAAMLGTGLLLGLEGPEAEALGEPGVTWSISIDPPVATEGDTVLVTAAASGQGGLPQYTLHLSAAQPPVLTLVSSANTHPPFLGQAASWTLQASRAGETTFSVSVNYEKQVCDDEQPPQCFFQFVDARSASMSVTVVPTAGDVNCDGVSTSIDAALILQRASGSLGSLPCPGGGDVNRDGVTNAIDALLILQYVAGLIPSPSLAQA